MSDRPEPEPRRLPSHEQAPAPTRYDRADPRRAGLPAPSTRVEPGRTHRPGDPAPLHLLPTALRDRYEVVGHEDGGAEADILIAVDRGDPDGPRVVVKTYRRQLPHADEIWGHLRGIRHRHLARLLEAGHSDGKQYEVMEWVPGRPLSELIPGQVPARPFPLARVTEAVGQLAEALAILHSRGIVHRDLKAENVILRDGDPDGPLDLVLIDFGLSRLDHDYAFTTFAAGTEHYLAPELLLRGGGTSSPARDWWALGMIVRELLTGVRNFTGYSVHAVYEAVVLRPVQLDAVTDARARLLCRGLLTVDPADRWGAEQIQAWLHGGNPDVVPATARQPELPPLELFGRTFRDGTALALALREPGFWESVAWSLSTPPDNRDSLPLFHWLRGLALTRQSAPGELDRLGDTLVDPALGNDLKVLRLLHWLDPSGQPVWRGRPVGRESLAAVAERAAAGVTEDVRVVDEAWRWRLLPEFARFAGNDSLRGADSTWQAHAAAHPAAVARVLARIPAAHYGPPHGNPRPRAGPPPGYWHRCCAWPSTPRWPTACVRSCAGSSAPRCHHHPCPCPAPARRSGNCTTSHRSGTPPCATARTPTRWGSGCSATTSRTRWPTPNRNAPAGTPRWPSPSGGNCTGPSRNSAAWAARPRPSGAPPCPSSAISRCSWWWASCGTRPRDRGRC